MDRLQLILNHPVYQDCLRQIKELEETRIFCGHSMVHLLDVARISYLISLEEQIKVEKEWIYAAALLHDIGRHLQYTEKIPHEIASAQIGKTVLMDTGFSEEEIQVISDAILHHRNSSSASEKNLRGLLYRGDKLSRPCFSCESEAQCDWSKKKKNMSLQY